MHDDDVVVYIVDDDPSVLKAAARLFRSAGLAAETFQDAQSFLDHRRPIRVGCLVLDLQLPGLDGIALQKELTDRGITLPVVFMTAYGDIPTTVEAMKLGAVDFLPKPVDDQRLLSAVQGAIDVHARTRRQGAAVAAFHQRVQFLTRRERDVMLLVIQGLLNKQIAGQLGITETTVKVHRGRVMQKTAVGSAAQLVLLCERAGLNTSVD